MPEVRAAVLYGEGLNTHLETREVLQSVGAAADLVHVNQLAADPAQLDRYGLVVVTGGFSHEDSMQSGIVLGRVDLDLRINNRLRDSINRGTAVIGICNGCQTLAKAGMVPDLSGTGEQEVTFYTNSQGSFIDTWVRLKRDPANRSPLLEGIDELDLPVRHGEGRFLVDPERPETLDKLRTAGCIAFRYIGPRGEPARFPYNPNGSLDAVAGLTNRAGNALVLMPHPEAYRNRLNHPDWHRGEATEPLGTIIFENAVRYARQQ